MSKQQAQDALTVKVSKADLVAATDVVYDDFDDPALNGINAHSIDRTPHGIDKIITDSSAEFNEVRVAMLEKIGIDYAELAEKLNTAGDTATGTIEVATNVEQVVLDGTAADNRSIIAQTNNLRRFSLDVANDDPETGSNAGSNLSVTRYSDAGAAIDKPFKIDRATGKTNVSKLKIGDGAVIGGAELDIRLQPTIPTDNLQVGTMWLTTEQACGTVKSTVLRPWGIRFGSSSYANGVLPREAIIPAMSDGALSDDSDSTYVVAIRDGAMQIYPHAILQSIQIPDDVMDFSVNVKARVRRPDSLPTITGWTPTNQIADINTFQLELSAIIRPGGWSHEEQYSVMSSDLNYQIDGSWVVKSPEVYVSDSTWTNVEFDFDVSSFEDWAHVLHRALKEGSATIAFYPWPSTGKVAATEISNVEVTISYIESPCAINDSPVLSRIDNDTWRKDMTGEIIQLTPELIVTQYNTIRKWNGDYAYAPSSPPPPLYNTNTNLHKFARLADDKYVEVRPSTTNRWDLKARMWALRDTTATVNQYVETNIYTPPGAARVTQVSAPLLLNSGRVGVFVLAATDNMLLTRVDYVEFSINQTDGTISSIVTLEVEANRDVSFGYFTKLFAATDGLKAHATFSTAIQGGGLSPNYTYVRRIRAVNTGLTPTLGGVYNFPAPAAYTSEVIIDFKYINYGYYTVSIERDNVATPHPGVQRISVKRFSYSSSYSNTRSWAVAENIHDIEQVYFGGSVTPQCWWHSRGWDGFLLGNSNGINRTRLNTDGTMTNEIIQMPEFSVVEDFFVYLDRYSDDRALVTGTFGFGGNDGYQGLLELGVEWPKPADVNGFGEPQEITGANNYYDNGYRYFGSGLLSIVKVAPQMAIIGWIQAPSNYTDPSPATAEFRLIGSTDGTVSVLDSISHPLLETEMYFNLERGYGSRIGDKAYFMFTTGGPDQTHNEGFSGNTAGIIAGIGFSGSQLVVDYVKSYGPVTLAGDTNWFGYMTPLTDGGMLIGGRGPLNTTLLCKFDQFGELQASITFGTGIGDDLYVNGNNWKLIAEQFGNYTEYHGTITPLTVTNPSGTSTTLSAEFGLDHTYPEFMDNQNSRCPVAGGPTYLFVRPYWYSGIELLEITMNADYTFNVSGYSPAFLYNFADTLSSSDMWYRKTAIIDINGAGNTICKMPNGTIVHGGVAYNPSNAYQVFAEVGVRPLTKGEADLPGRRPLPSGSNVYILDQMFYDESDPSVIGMGREAVNDYAHGMVVFDDYTGVVCYSYYEVFDDYNRVWMAPFVATPVTPMTDVYSEYAPGSMYATGTDWVLDWTQQLPERATGIDCYIEMTLSAVGAGNTITVDVESLTGGNGYTPVVISGGPFTVDQVVQTPIFTADMAGFTSAEAYISNAQGFQTSAAKVVFIDRV